jgi:hypothetical protein
LVRLTAFDARHKLRIFGILGIERDQPFCITNGRVALARFRRVEGETRQQIAIVGLPIERCLQHLERPLRIARIVVRGGMDVRKAGIGGIEPRRLGELLDRFCVRLCRTMTSAST